MSEPIIYDHVEIGEGTTIEPYAILGIVDRFHPVSPTIIGQKSFIGSRCTVYCNVTTGNGFDISDQSTVFYDNHFGDDCRIGPKSVIKNGCRIGDRVRVNSQTFLERVQIGSDVFIGPGTIFTDDMHPPCPHNKECTPFINVGDRVSIGANATICPGVDIGNNSQIYAGAVVVKNVEPFSVVAGVPARKIGDTRELTCPPGLMKHPFEPWLIADDDI
ncbi:acyltransferase [Nisaea sp.]|uniref:acyltransferase n=1 Tax=Nisaea sp. TaxID=2024842 RepID=UPI002B26EC05|nr:DapH/DapD/GlmU-related protein [Nisaea sp.]